MMFARRLLISVIVAGTILVYYFATRDHKTSTSFENMALTTGKVRAAHFDDIIKNNLSIAGSLDNTYVRMEKDDQSLPIVLLLTYLRGGSTFLADVIQQSPDVFYLYEPLKPFLKRAYFTDNGVCTIYGDCRISSTRTEDPQIILKYIEELYHCQLQMMVPEAKCVLTNIASQDGRWYKHCIHTKLVADCLNPLRQRCQQSIRSFKFIRLSFSIVEILMDRLPSLKVIHLLRDPRGIINSRSKTGYMWTMKKKDSRSINNKLSRNPLFFNRFRNHTDTSTTNIIFKYENKQTENNNILNKSIEIKPPQFYIERHAVQLCSQMAKDISINSRLDKLKPGRIKTVQYENLAEHPIEVAKILYKFIGTKFTKSTEEYIHRITMTNLKFSGDYSTTRSNSSVTAHSWKQQLSTEHVNIIDKHCKNVYNFLGYQSK